MRPRPISGEEFTRFFQKSKPSLGWPARIGVANSGGPDSTCLLFLLERYIANSPPFKNSSPERVYSLTIDHALQESSADMAAQAARNAKSLHIPHTTVRIPWGTPPFPPLPDKSLPFEAKARAARYHLFWKWMRKEDIGALALGHHADDQVETGLMRLGKGSSELGGRGMSRCRRWGMGARNDLEWVGYEGLNKWVVRPLLEFPKDRILATCEENELPYVTDPSNFQPEVTLRNALRAIISSNANGENAPDLGKLPAETRRNIQSINTTLDSISHLSVNLGSPPERLRAAIGALDVFAADIEDQATRLIGEIQVLSPPGSFILASDALQTITNPLLKRAIILRILRYVSPFPWGCLRDQARRSSDSLEQIISNVWKRNPFMSPGSRAFTAGASVLWTPVIVDLHRRRPNFIEAGGKIRRPLPESNSSKNIKRGVHVVGWMASRQPPLSAQTMENNGQEDTLNVDITVTLREALEAWDDGKGEGPTTIEIFWDCRYLVKFDLSKMPVDLKTMLLTDTSGRPIIAIRWWTDFFVPRIVLIHEGCSLAYIKGDPREAAIHSTVENHMPLILLTLKSTLNSEDLEAQSSLGKRPAPTAEWIHTSWIRPIDPT